MTADKIAAFIRGLFRFAFWGGMLFMIGSCHVSLWQSERPVFWGLIIVYLLIALGMWADSRKTIYIP